MKSLSAHHLRLARAELEPARAYRDGVNGLLATVGLAQEASISDRTAVLLVAADLGLCDGYNQRLTEAALAEHGRRPGPLYCFGRRPDAALRRAGVAAARRYGAPTSAAGIPRVLLQVADDVLRDYLDGTFARLLVVSARFDGVGAFTPTTTTVLPIVPPAAARKPAATPYSGTRALRRATVREYLYSTLYELLVDALASEHGARLVATSEAGNWLDDRLAELNRYLLGVRQEAGTQEVLDVASAARMRRRRTG